jgi:3-dehydroquinate dehydratase II
MCVISGPHRNPPRMKLMIINGPNLNLLGTREPAIYGYGTFEEYLEKLRELYPVITFGYFQSNVEGELINALHNARDRYDGVILNSAGYTHTSVAIGDAVAAIGIPVIEVHISNIYNREEYRHVSMIAGKCIGVITGFGLDSYKLAVEAFLLRR